MANLILTGMRGTGKSQIARQIAKTLKRKYIDIDREIERQEHKSISKIVNLKGWSYFRKIEKYVTRRVANFKDAVISTGGGTIIDPENYKKLKKQGIIVLLVAPTPILANRLAAKTEELTKRPALTATQNSVQELETVWQKRKAKYTDTADYEFDVSQESEDLKKDTKQKAKAIIDLISVNHPEFRKPE